MRFPTSLPKSNLTPRLKRIANTIARPAPPEIEIEVNGNSSSLTIDITLEPGGGTGNDSHIGTVLPLAISPITSELDSILSSIVPTVTDISTSSSNLPSSDGAFPSLTSSASRATFTTTTSSASGATFTTTPSTSTATLTSLTSASPGLIDASPFTSASNNVSVPLIVVILRTLFG